MKNLLAAITGYRRPFASLDQAKAALAGFDSGGHANPDNAKLHLDLALRPRPSDYPALYHLNRVMGEVRRVFDLGGNVGNLYYCYRDYLDLPLNLEWKVYDIPEMLEIGRDLARNRGERHLAFTTVINEAGAADLLLASGSLHYFPAPLPEIVARFDRKPAYILINRTPLLEGASTATVQDAGGFLVACNLFDRGKLLKGFRELGYELLDSWRVDELSVIIPGYPDLSVPVYSGFFLGLSGRQSFASQHLT